MKINTEILQKIVANQAQILIVSKYLEIDETQEIVSLLAQQEGIIGFGENRVKNLEAKQIPRDKCHFIGNIQSRQIPIISRHCSVVHSLENLRHARLFAEVQAPPAVFIQINVSNEDQKGGVLVKNLSKFIQEIPKNLHVLGLSAIGATVFNQNEKKAEFELLKELRDKYVPKGRISAGTSCDYEIALESGIDIVRVGRALFD